MQGGEFGKRPEAYLRLFAFKLELARKSKSEKEKSKLFKEAFAHSDYLLLFCPEIISCNAQR